MDDGELELSNHEMFSGSSFGDLPSNSSMGNFLDEILKDTHACTHAHTCNPPGLDNSHTHTCYHVHTKIVPGPSEEKTPDDSAESTENKKRKRPIGNKEAVRKYREKKKAKASSLEDEVIKLRALNQQLIKRLQGQAVLEAEVARLKCLLVDIRGRIEGEIGSFPYQRPCDKTGDVYQNLVNPNMPGAYMMNPCNKQQCDDQLYCLHPEADGNEVDSAAFNGQGYNDCEFETLQCLGNQNSGSKELPGCGIGNSVPFVNPNTVNGSRRRVAGARPGTTGGKMLTRGAFI